MIYRRIYSNRYHPIYNQKLFHASIWVHFPIYYFFVRVKFQWMSIYYIYIHHCQSNKWRVELLTKIKKGRPNNKKKKIRMELKKI
jgi:hypothetical protein